ncbi:MAG: hypothetical protein AB7O73_01385 [Bacteroidia bacterium]
MKLKFACIFFILSFITLNAQEIKQSLIVVHPELPIRAEFKQKIYAYNFLNGHFTGRTELLTVDGKKGGKDYVRTDLGSPTIYKDRYLITGIGNIVDLVDKKVLFDGRAKLVACRNDSAIFYTNDFVKGKFYSVYDFKSKKYGEVKKLTFKAKIGQDVEFDKTKAPFKLFLYPVDKPKVEIVKDAGYGQKVGKGTIPDPPMWWVDHSNLIFAYYNEANTEIRFYKVNVDSKKTTHMGTLPFKPGNSEPIITKEDENVTTLNYGDKLIAVNEKTDKVEELNFTYSVNGFSAEVKASSAGRRILFANTQKELGKFHFQLKNFKTNEKSAGLVKEIIVGTDSYQQGLAVWNFDKNKFVNVDAEEVLTVLGWINN